MPFEPGAEPAAELALEAWTQKGNDGFWHAHDKLFASQSLEPADLDRIAGELGLDVPSARTAIDSKKHKARIDADQTLALAIEEGSWSDTSDYPRYGSVDGGITPRICINGIPVDLEQTAAPDLESYVEQAIKRFEQEHGDIAAKDWYEHVTAKAPLGSPHRSPRRPESSAKPARSGLSNEGVHLAGDRTRRGAFEAVPRAAIVKAVSDNADRIRLCHQEGLRSNAALEGRVFVEVVIDRSGAVSLAQDGGSSLPDASVVQCVIAAVKTITFPRVEAAATAFVAVLKFTPVE
jgi:hypothetical protein